MKQKRKQKWNQIYNAKIFLQKNLVTKEITNASEKNYTGVFITIQKKQRNRFYLRYLSERSARILADDLASQNKLLTSSISCFLMHVRFFTLANRLAGHISWAAYLEKKKLNLVLH